MVFRHAPIPRKGSGKQQQQQHNIPNVCLIQIWRTLCNIRYFNLRTRATTHILYPFGVRRLHTSIPDEDCQVVSEETASTKSKSDLLKNEKRLFLSSPFKPSVPEGIPSHVNTSKVLQYIARLLSLANAGIILKYYLLLYAMKFNNARL